MALNIGVWPFVGRQRELDRVSAELTRPDAAGVLVAGPAGVGKSRLAAESTVVAQHAGFSVTRLLATRAASRIPLGALAPYLPAEFSPPALRGDTLKAVADAIAGRDDRLLLMVDDAHLLDDASATVIQHLVALNRVSVVLTTRSGEAPPEPLVALWKDNIIERIDLAPLGQAEVDRLLDAVLPGPIDGACRCDLWEASRGNVLFLHELVLGALDAGVLRREGDLWCLTQDLSTTPRLRELVGARLADLETREREVLEHLALGEPLELDVIAHVGDVAVVDRLERRGLAHVGETAPRRVRLGHPLHGDVLRDQMTAVRRMAISQRLADAAEAHGLDRPDDILRAVIWRLDSGGPVDPTLMLGAARQAFFANDLPLAERLARAALEARAGVAAGLLLAQVLGDCGRHEERRALLYQLEAQTTTDDEFAMVVMCRADSAFLGLGQLAEADGDLARAGRRLPPGPWRDEIITQRAGVAFVRGQLAHSIMLAKPILATSRSGRAMVKAAFAAGGALALTGQCAQASAVAEQGSVVQLALGDQEVIFDPVSYVIILAIAFGVAGKLREAEAILTNAYHAALASRNRWAQAWCVWYRGNIALLTGHVGTAARFFAEAVMTIGRFRLHGYHRWCLAGQAMAAAQQADLSTTDAVIARLDAVPPDPAMTFEPEVLRARAWHAHVRGDPGQAHALLHEAVHCAASMGAHALEVAAWHDLVRLGAAAEAAAPLTRLAKLVEGDLVQARASHAAGAADDDSGLLIAAADRFEALGACLFAAEATAAASAAYRRRQQSRLADRLSTRAHALTMRCEGAATPALELAGPAAALTSREREVAALAAQGLSSKAIAERFTLSVRTVDTHLQRIYVKLGITGRNELAAVLAAHLPVGERQLRNHY